MAESHVISALRRKYAELKGVLKYLPAEDPEPTLVALRQVGAVLRMFAPSEDLSAVAPIRPYAAHRHRWSRTALDILRREGRPMTARALARRVLEAQGVLATAETILPVECSLHAVLGRLEGQGVVRVSEEPKHWAIARYG